MRLFDEAIGRHGDHHLARTGINEGGQRKHRRVSECPYQTDDRQQFDQTWHGYFRMARLIAPGARVRPFSPRRGKGEILAQ
jgi:hypothetical protein